MQLFVMGTSKLVIEIDYKYNFFSLNFENALFNALNPHDKNVFPYFLCSFRIFSVRNMYYFVSGLLKPMETAPCLIKTVDWWTYEFCYGSVIKQYHLEGLYMMNDLVNLVTVQEFIFFFSCVIPYYTYIFVIIIFSTLIIKVTASRKD